MAALGVWLRVALITTGLAATTGPLGCGPGLSADQISQGRFERITSDGWFKQRPRWSPDGRSVVFARHGADSIFLYRRDLQTGEETRLTDRKSPEYDAVFSPDGQSMLFSLDRTSPNQGDLEIYRLHLETREVAPVAVTDKKLSHEESADWSPDGRRLVFTSTRDGNQEVYVGNVAGGDWTRLTSDPAIDAHPSWSPDGTTIAFATDRWGDLEIALVRPDGTGLKRLTHSRGLDDYPVWSPDGRMLAFVSNRAGNLDICLCSPETGEVRPVTTSSAIDNFPAWTPDGQLGFVSNRDGGFEIYVTRAFSSFEPPAATR